MRGVVRLLSLTHNNESHSCSAAPQHCLVTQHTRATQKAAPLIYTVRAATVLSVCQDSPTKPAFATQPAPKTLGGLARRTAQPPAQLLPVLCRHGPRLRMRARCQTRIKAAPACMRPPSFHLRSPPPSSGMGMMSQARLPTSLHGKVEHAVVLTQYVQNGQPCDSSGG